MYFLIVIFDGSRSDYVPCEDQTKSPGSHMNQAEKCMCTPA